MSTGPEYRAWVRQILLREAAPAHKFGHQPRLYRLCCEIGKGLPYDDDVVYAAVWLHDLGVFEGNRPREAAALERWDHVAYAVARTRNLLADSDFPADKIERVVAAIEEHQPRDTPSTVEATIVRDADILEQLGAGTVLRTAAKLGSDTRFHRFADVRDALMRQLETLPPMLRLPRARALAEPRVAALQQFLESLEREAGEELF